MKIPTSERKHGIKWTARNQVENLNFADDLTLLTHTHQQMQRKATRVAAASASVGLNIYKGKSKIIKYNTENTKPITLDEEAVEQVESFTFLGSITDERGGSDVDIKARIGKASTLLLQLKNIWKSKQLSTNSKARIYNTNVKTVSSIVRS
ncbi:unnamed protein product [Schistosoma curassoni]|uniref:DUF6451 domain-containing protein n=1 Tax=Schistosoma curassoni TaxID=6186 RepID=A0A183L0B8_9TREM|nr:unnamed protein product [Schistosoma curassoni]